jgi:hypothetical protein
MLTQGNLALALAPALTPAGIDDNPSFFRGFTVYPQVLARGLLVLADITSTRYFNYAPAAQRDPVLSAQENRLRAECFSACNGVYARLDLLGSGFDGEIGLGTTNVDIGIELRSALSRIQKDDRLFLNIGTDGFTARPIGPLGGPVVALGTAVNERPVQMPGRWVRALGNAAEIHRGMVPRFMLKGTLAQTFIAALPPATGKNQSGWLTPAASGAKVLPRRSTGAVFVSGMHRLSGLKRIMTNISALSFYEPETGDSSAFMVVADLPGARVTLSLTAKDWQGYSGEGALLGSLAQPEVLENAESIASSLQFDATVDETRLARTWQMDKAQVDAALAVLAVSGKLGFDAHDRAWFHRELPDDPDRVLRDNPRLVAAQKLVDMVRSAGENIWLVSSGGTEYRVRFDPQKDMQDAKCTCTWYLNHQNKRGPCKHILAVQLKEQNR